MLTANQIGNLSHILRLSKMDIVLFSKFVKSKLFLRQIERNLFLTFRRPKYGELESIFCICPRALLYKFYYMLENDYDIFNRISIRHSRSSKSR